MAQELMQRNDLINGRHGMGVITTEDGLREEMIYIKNIKVPVETSVKEIKRLGTNKNIHIQSSGSQKWSADIYRVTRLFRNIMVKFLNEGIETRFDMILIQNDPNHSRGAEKIILKGCLIDRADLINLDIESEEAIGESVSGTYEDVEVLE